MSVVYVMRRADGVGPVKIGCTKYPVQRLAQQQLWSPEPLEIIGTAPGGFKDEGRLHREFAEYRLHGEWFEASCQVLALVAKICATGELPPANVNDKWERICDMYRSGMTLAAIGGEFGITRERVRQILRRAGVPSAGRRPSCRAKVTKAHVKQMIALAPAMSVREIAERLGLNRQNVYTHLCKNGVKAKVGKRQCRPDTIERAFAIAADYKSGMKTREIAGKYGTQQATIYRFLKVANVKATRSATKLSLPDHEIATLYERGASLLTLAAKYGVGQKTIRRRLTDHGVSIRSRVGAVLLANTRDAAQC